MRTLLAVIVIFAVALSAAASGPDDHSLGVASKPAVSSRNFTGNIIGVQIPGVVTRTKLLDDAMMEFMLHPVSNTARWVVDFFSPHKGELRKWPFSKGELADATLDALREITAYCR